MAAKPRQTKQEPQSVEQPAQILPRCARNAHAHQRDRPGGADPRRIAGHQPSDDRV